MRNIHVPIIILVFLVGCSKPVKACSTAVWIDNSGGLILRQFHNDKTCALINHTKGVMVRRDLSEMQNEQNSNINELMKSTDNNDISSFVVRKGFHDISIKLQSFKRMLTRRANRGFGAYYIDEEFKVPSIPDKTVKSAINKQRNNESLSTNEQNAIKFYRTWNRIFEIVTYQPPGHQYKEATSIESKDGKLSIKSGKKKIPILR